MCRGGAPSLNLLHVFYFFCFRSPDFRHGNSYGGYIGRYCNDVDADTNQPHTPLSNVSCGIFILWGGGAMKDFAYSFYRSAAWKKCRQSYIDKRILIDGGLCEECHERAGYIVHHRTLLTPANICDPEVSLNHANLEFVCKKCHDNFEGHFCQKSPKKLTKCEFDAFGMPVPPSNLD